MTRTTESTPQRVPTQNGNKGRRVPLRAADLPPLMSVPPSVDAHPYRAPLLSSDSTLHDLPPTHAIELLKAGAAPVVNKVLPLTERERQFQDGAKSYGVIDATLLTDDPTLRERIEGQPGLAWQIHKVQQRSGKHASQPQPGPALRLDL